MYGNLISTYNGYRIMGNEEHPCRPEIVNKIIELITTYSQAHSKSFVVAFGLNFPTGSQALNNQSVIQFWDSFVKHLGSHKLQPAYLWVREQAGSHNHHYHCLLLLDGQKVQNRFGVMKEAARLWGGINKCDPAGLVHYEWNPWMLRRGSASYEQDMADCIYAVTYLAKTYSKGNAAPRQREFGYSRLAFSQTAN